MSETFERITPDQVDAQAGHVYRYLLALDWIERDQKVIDVACGVGYGAKILAEKKVHYFGVDKIEADDQYIRYGNWLFGVDLNTHRLNWQGDVAICFETLEHLENPQHLADELMAAAPVIVVSVPTRPTKHMNEYHLHDFTVDDILAMFNNVELVHLEDQPEELSHIFVFRKRDAA
jgi:2-polyprenyl-3-methyl-5-hydroxy-6-metoxy-1,4-benzoquinol methylase